jgi:two-component system CheB/CheR fusion protein
MTDERFDILLSHLRETRGFDFTAYKRPSLKRRIDRRLQTLDIKTYEGYLDHIEVHPDEFNSLFNTILINVTGFFRDPPVWDLVRREVIPAILASKSSSDSIRVWTAGCASGEEAYTLAMVLADAVGVDEFKSRVKIYATDVDEEALSHARHALYTDRQVEGIPEPLLAKYFDKSNQTYTFDREMRRSVIFGRHDLVHDAPISRVDLISCRNTLMYFNGEAQARILSRFHYSLTDSGFLLLGRAEMPVTDGALFVPVNLKHRIFKAGRPAHQRDRLLALAHGNGDHATAPLGEAQTRMREAAFEGDALPQIVVDADGLLQLANDAARRQFGISQRHLGQQFHNLEISYRPADLRSGIDQAIVERRPVTIKDVQWSSAPNDARYVDVCITPLIGPTGGVLATRLAFPDVTRYKLLEKELQTSRRELETAYEELQSTNEELETTNEELQSTVEELETTNEELQSTNEELETMNEELQSTNEELETMNQELRTRGSDLNDVNSFLEAVLTSLRAAVIVVDGNLHVLAWNRRSEDLWGLRPEEARGQHLLNLDIGLPVHELKGPVRATLAGSVLTDPIALAATNRRGRPLQCRVTCSPLTQGARVRGAILVIDEIEALPDAD